MPLSLLAAAADAQATNGGIAISAHDATGLERQARGVVPSPSPGEVIHTEPFKAKSDLDFQCMMPYAGSQV